MAVERESSRFTTVFSWDSLSADIPPFPVIQSYDCGERGGGHAVPELYAIPGLHGRGGTGALQSHDCRRAGTPGHAFPGFTLFQSYAMVADRPEHYSLTTVDVHGHAVPGLYAFLSSSLMAVERQEHPSLTTVVVHGYAVPSPPSLLS